MNSALSCSPSYERFRIDLEDRMEHCERLHQPAEDKLAERFSESITVDDLSRLPHLPQDHWVDVRALAHEGWEVDDRFD